MKALWLMLAAASLGCGAAVPSHVLCAVAAAEKLPDNPDLLTYGEIRTLVDDLKACKAPPGDAGPTH